jgi:periplasmic protein TonB
LSLLLAFSLLWVGGPPQVRLLQLTAPLMAQPLGDQAPHLNRSSGSSSHTNQIFAPRVVPREIPTVGNPSTGLSVLDAPNIDPIAGPMIGVANSIGNQLPVVIPARPVPPKPLAVSHWAEGNLIYRVQPLYPTLARQARIQGTVELRAVISKSGTIENLTVVSGHPMLVRSALDAVKQWRYRPYVLNGEPIEVETNITVNFLLSGG